MSLQPGPRTFTTSRLLNSYRNPPNKISRHEYFNRTDRSYGHETQASARAWCEELFEAASEPVDHIAALDESFDAIYTVQFGRQTIEADEIVSAAASVLSRLPSNAPDIFPAFSVTASDLKPYFHPDSPGDSTDSPWLHLAVASYVPAVILRAALHINCPIRRGFGNDGRLVANGTLELLRTAFSLSNQAPSSDQAAWTIVNAFLFTAWSRLISLFLWQKQVRQLQSFDDQWDREGLLDLQSPSIIPDLAQVLREVQSSQVKTIPYLCPWSFRLLANNYASVAMDLRRFFEAYGEVHSGREARCKAGTQCDGASPVTCERFVSHGIVNQSAHDNCAGCDRLFWDRDSFVSLSGARAVRLDSSDELSYQPTSPNTMAVSHVWSHGQGGRPNIGGDEGTGLNRCLHERYVIIAKRFGCDSYWLDTPCIPSEFSLKKECIKFINPIFSDSKLVLVCDADIMRIDISERTPVVCERILASLLVCDWNVRAWTLLEAMRGRFNLHLLCAQNETISVLEVIRTVHERGRIDLGILVINSSQLMPSNMLVMKKSFYETLFDDDDDYDFEEHNELERVEHVAIGDAAVLLSHRHMTRDQDDVLIWGLLTGEETYTDPVKLWRSRVGHKVSTGSLVSSSPRIKNVDGLSWAPSCPTFRYTEGGRVYIGSDGAETIEGTITEEGFKAHWFTSRLESGEKKRYASLQGYKHGLLLQASPKKGRTRAVRYGNNEKGPLVVVCGSQDDEYWKWLDVFEWDTSLKLPSFAFNTVLIN